MAVYDLAHIKDGYSDFSACSKKFDSLYSSFKSSYVSTCADSSINKMENTLNKYFQKIDTAYNKIGAVWKNFYSDIKASDNALAGGSKGGVSASSAVSILSSMPSLNDFSDSLNMSIKGNDIQVSDVSALSGIVLGESVAGYNLSTGHTTASDAQKDVGAKELMSEYVNDENSVFKRAFIKMPDGTMKEVDVEDGTTAEEIVDKYNISTDDLVFDVSDKNGTSQAWVSLNELTEGVEQPSNNMEVKAKFDTEIVEDNNTINNIADENNTENLTIETTTGDDALTTTKAESAATFGAIGGVVGSIFGNPLMGAALGAATGAIFSNNKVVSKITEKVVGGVKKVGEVFKRVAATVSTFIMSLFEGLVKLVEDVVDLVALIGTGVASVVTGIADGVNYVAAKAKGDDSLITHHTKEMWDGTRGFVSKNFTKSVFDSFYNNTSVGSWLKENSYGFDTIRSIGSEVGEVVGVVALSLVTGGGAAVMYGAAKAAEHTETAWQDENTSTAKGLLKGAVKGTLDGVFFAIGSGADKAAKGAAEGVAKAALKESGIAVAEDATKAAIKQATKELSA